jgi:hypothetical protein
MSIRSVSLADVENHFKGLPSLEPEELLPDLTHPCRERPSLEPLTFGSLANVENPFRHCPSLDPTAGPVSIDNYEVEILQPTEQTLLILTIVLKAIGVK